MSIPVQEAESMRRAWSFLLGLSSGEIKLDRARPVREEARSILKHFPLGGDLEHAARAYAPELLGKVEREADELAQEAARESARANAAEAKKAAEIPPDFLNMP
jgi:regulator of protease activity HflC (stomatin/prohibitin superfamily)